MPLTHDELETRAVDGYFGSVNRRDTETLLGHLAPGCVMHVVSAGIRYEGKQAIVDHFDEFLEEYPEIAFADFQPTADEPCQKVAVRFTITLTDRAGEETVMTNCNFFDLDDEGRFAHVAIYMSDLPPKGFDKGAAP